MASPLSRIDLRERERALLLGGTQVGKSVLAEELGRSFVQRYASRKGRRLILDSKPRYRGELLVSGLPAKRLYKQWDHGVPVAGSCVVFSPQQMREAFRLGHRTVIAQGGKAADVDWLTQCAALFLEDSRRGRPQLLQVDEVKDFYHSNGATRGPDDAITRAFRAGAERGTAALCCSQRTRGINSELLEHTTACYLFRLDARGDVKRLAEFGAPEQLAAAMPSSEHVFVYWTKRHYGQVWGPYRVRVERAA